MNSQRLHQIIIPVIDGLTGFDIKSNLEKSLDFDFLSREQILTYQREKFRELSVIAGRSDYYRDFSGKSLDQYPLMEREEYSKNYPRLNTKHKSTYYYRRSSGSTGSPVQHQITKQMLQAKRVSHQKMLTWHGLQREAPELKIGGMPVDVKTNLYYKLRNKIFFNSYLLKRNRIHALAGRYNKFKPEVLYGYPSLIHKFLSFCESEEISVYPPKIIVTHAENLYPEHVEKLNEIFPGVPVVNQYWATEGNIAETCPEGNLHLAEDTVICELLNKDPDGTGDLYLTNLFSYRIPIIRYKIGDRIRISAKRCSCGRNTRIIEHIEGREIDYIELPDGRRHPVTAIYLTNLTQNILTYQLVQYRKKGKVELHYVPVNKDLPIEDHRIYKHMKERFGLHTEFCPTQELELTSGGKFKRIIVAD